MYGRHTPFRYALQRPWPGTRRGLCLWLFSLAFIFLGLVNYTLTVPPQVTLDALQFATYFAPITFWGSVMSSFGAVALYTSYCHFGRDRFGYVLLAGFCAVWGSVYWCGYLFFDANLRAVSGSIIWLLFAAILVTLAGLPAIPLKDIKMAPGKDPFEKED